MPTSVAPAPGYVLLVNGSSSIPATGQQWTTVVSQDGWKISQEFGRQATTANFQLYDEHRSAAPSFVPQPLWTIQLIDTTLNITLFAGVITKPTYTFDSPVSTVWDIDCVDYSYYADAAITLGDFSYQTSDAMILSLTAATNCGITAKTVANGGFVQPGPKIPRYRAEYIPLSDAWTQISKLAAGVGKGLGTNLGGVDWGWFVDENLALHFYPMQAAPSVRVALTDNVLSQPTYGQTTIAAASNGAVLPQGTINVLSTAGWLTTGGQISVVTSTGLQQVAYAGLTGTTFTGCSGGTGTMSTNNIVVGTGYIKADSVKYEYDGQNLRDSVLVWGGNVIGTKTDVFQGNGVQTQWPLTFQILSTNPRLKLTINGISYTVGIATSDPTQTGTQQRTQFVVSQNANGQWFMQTGRNLNVANPGPQLAPSAGTTIVLQYNFQAPVVARVDDQAQQAAYGRAPFQSSANTSFTNTSATDTSANWSPNQWAGLRVSTGGFTAAVISNTGTVLTTTPWYPSKPPDGSVFTVGWSPNSGVFQVAIKDKTILDVGTAQLRASNQLAQYSKLQERMNFTMVDNWPGHLKAGDTFLLQSQFVPDSQSSTAFSGTIGSVSGATFFCHSVDISPAEGKSGYRTYQIMAQRIS